MAASLAVSSGGLHQELDDTSAIKTVGANVRTWHWVAAAVHFVVASIGFGMNAAASYKYDAPIVDVYTNFADPTNSITQFGQSSMPVHWLAVLPSSLLFLYYFTVWGLWDDQGHPTRVIRGSQRAVAWMGAVWGLMTLVVALLVGVASTSALITVALAGFSFVWTLSACEMTTRCDSKGIYNPKYMLIPPAFPAAAILTAILTTAVQVGSSLPTFVKVLVIIYCIALVVQLAPPLYMISGKAEGQGLTVTAEVSLNVDIWKIHTMTWGVSAVMLTAIAGMYHDRM